jgi:hypothetical protein
MDITGRVLVKHLFTDRIAAVREGFKKKINSIDNVLQIVYQQDIDKTLTNDIWVEKFLEWNAGNVNKTVDNLLYSLKKQKEYRLRELSESDFAAEFFIAGVRFEYEPDRLGRKTIYTRVKYGAICKETRQLAIQSMLYYYLRLAETSDEKGTTTIVDFADASVNNIDLVLMKTAADFSNIFPNCVSLMVQVNMPYAIKFVVKTVMLAMPSETRKAMLFLNQEELQEIVDPANLPDFLGGTCQRPYCGPELVPKNCSRMMDSLMRFVKETDENNNDPSKTLPLLLPLMDRKTVERIWQYYMRLLCIEM